MFFKYIGWIQKTCQNLNCNISITLHYIWSIFLTLLLHDDIFIPVKSYDCSFTNIPTASKTKHEVNYCNVAMTYFVVLQLVTLTRRRDKDWASVFSTNGPKYLFPRSNGLSKFSKRYFFPAFSYPCLSSSLVNFSVRTR
jgi:hypothetical protein